MTSDNGQGKILTSGELYSTILAAAQPLAEAGVPPDELRQTVFEQTGYLIGPGGQGPHDVPKCRYCGASGGGGHGGLCPQGWT